MFRSGAGISMAPPAASAAAAGSTPQASALSPIGSATPQACAYPSTVSASRAIHETGTEEKARRMKAELKTSEIGWVCNEGQPIPQLETLLKPQNWFVKSDLYSEL